jgi:hypothetical protein
MTVKRGSKYGSKIDCEAKRRIIFVNANRSDVKIFLKLRENAKKKSENYEGANTP